MSALTGTGALVRFDVRRDRVRMLVWIIGIVALVETTSASVKGLYPTAESLAKAAAISEGNVAAIVFNGPVQALDTLGGQIAFQVGSFGLIVVGLMSIFMVGRLTRSEEENGRTELLLATAVGRHAPLAAALILVTAMNVVVGVLVTANLILVELPVTGSVAFGISFVAMGLVFAGVAAVAAQITENTRVVYGSSGILLAAAFVLRALGDIGDGRLSWFSPIGWSQKLRPFAGEQWWTLIVPAAATAVLTSAAWLLAARRDVGAGLVDPRPGPPVASPSLGHPLGLALRLQRGSLIGWGAGMVLGGVSYGSVANQIDQFIADNPAMADYFTRFGGATLTEAFFATSFLMLGLIGSGFAVQSTLRLHSEEAALRAEPLLATPVSRLTWAASHLLVTLVGSGIVLALGGLGAALTYGIIIKDFSSLPRLLGASVVYLPAVWVLVAVAVTLFGLFPRAVMAAWGALALALLIGLFGDLLKLPAGIRDLSPFEHVPRLPAGTLGLAPVAILTAVAALLLAVGLFGFRRRDTPA
jgi:ABC-2 type transport system permease protein